MKKPISAEVIERLRAAVREVAGESGTIHIIGVRICEHCRGEDVEAFPYGVEDAQGRYWEILCNDCFDWLGCSYGDEEAVQS